MFARLLCKIQRTKSWQNSHRERPRCRYAYKKTVLEFKGIPQMFMDCCTRKALSYLNFLRIQRIFTNSCIFLGHFFQNWFPGSAHNFPDRISKSNNTFVKVSVEGVILISVPVVPLLPVAFNFPIGIPSE